MNIKTIMCPTDFSRFSEAALDYASTLAGESNALLYIVHVDEGSPTYVPGFEGYAHVPDPVEDREEERRKLLNETEPTAGGVNFQRRYLVGVPEKEILAFAERENVELIVLGTHGRTGVSRLLMGSIAEAVVRRANCPVLTVKQPMAQRDEPLVAAVDRRAEE